MTLIRERPVLIACLLALTIFAVEMGFFNLAGFIGREGAARAQGWVLLTEAMLIPPYLYALRMCLAARRERGYSIALLLFAPSFALGFFIIPEFACNAGHGCM